MSTQLGANKGGKVGEGAAATSQQGVLGIVGVVMWRTYASRQSHTHTQTDTHTHIIRLHTNRHPQHIHNHAITHLLVYQCNTPCLVDCMYTSPNLNLSSYHLGNTLLNHPPQASSVVLTWCMTKFRGVIDTWWWNCLLVNSWVIVKYARPILTLARWSR